MAKRKNKNKACPEARRVAGVVSGQRARQHAGSTLHSIGRRDSAAERIMQRMQLEPFASARA